MGPNEFRISTELLLVVVLLLVVRELAEEPGSDQFSAYSRLNNSHLH